MENKPKEVKLARTFTTNITNTILKSRTSDPTGSKTISKLSSKDKTKSKNRSDLNDLAYTYINNIADYVVRNKSKIEQDILGGDSGFILTTKNYNQFRNNIMSIFQSLIREYNKFDISLFVVDKGFSTRNLPILFTANNYFGDLAYAWILIANETKHTLYYTKIYIDEEVINSKKQKVGETYNLKPTYQVLTEKLESLYETKKKVI